MRHINLLPWREEQRQLSQRRFYQYTLALAGSVLLLILLVSMELGSLIDSQAQRNGYLRGQIQSLDIRLGEVEGAQSVRKQLNQRLAVVQGLQQSRTELVHEFDALPRTVPAGVMLEALTQKGEVWQIRGSGTTNAEISRFIRNLDESPWFHGARLSVVNTGTDSGSEGGARDSHFVLDVQTGKAGAGQ